jgi:hypothetical protein
MKRKYLVVVVAVKYKNRNCVRVHKKKKKKKTPTHTKWKCRSCDNRNILAASSSSIIKTKKKSFKKKKKTNEIMISGRRVKMVEGRKTGPDDYRDGARVPRWWLYIVYPSFIIRW